MRPVIASALAFLILVFQSFGAGQFNRSMSYACGKGLSATHLNGNTAEKNASQCPCCRNRSGEIPGNRISDSCQGAKACCVETEKTFIKSALPSAHDTALDALARVERSHPDFRDGDFASLSGPATFSTHPPLPIYLLFR